MDKRKWKGKIVKACKDANTYEPYFDSVIDTLAGILEKRDNAEILFAKLGSNTVIRHTNKNGATNIVRNPSLSAIMDLNTQALSYWKELGLTPSGLKKLNAGKQDGDNITFEKLIASIADEQE